MKYLISAVVASILCFTAQANAADASKINILGVKTGMTPKQVEAKLKSRGFRVRDKNRYKITDSDEVFLNSEFYVADSEDQHGTVTVRYARPPHAPVVVAVSRGFGGGDYIPIKKLKSILINAYGEPTKSDGRLYVWYTGKSKMCADYYGTYDFNTYIPPREYMNTCEGEIFVTEYTTDRMAGKRVGQIQRQIDIDFPMWSKTERAFNEHVQDLHDQKERDKLNNANSPSL